MGKVVVYIQARDETELRAQGHDPKEWVKNLVKTTLEERRRTRLFPEPHPPSDLADSPE